MPTTEKAATISEIAEQFRSSSAAVITEYRGLTMAQLTTLRRSLGAGTAYTVAKNTLVKRAAADAGVSGLDELFTGPTAVAFVAGEPVEAAKALRDFAKTNPLLVIKGGLLDGKPLDPAGVSKLADLESREVLLAKLAGAMLGTLSKAAYAFTALPSKMAQLAAALQEKNAAGAPEQAPDVDGGGTAGDIGTDVPADTTAGADTDSTDSAAEPTEAPAQA